MHADRDSPGWSEGDNTQTRGRSSSPTARLGTEGRKWGDPEGMMEMGRLEEEVLLRGILGSE